MSELPKGWEIKKLSEIASTGLISDGDWVESKDQDPSGAIRLIQLADIGDGNFKDKSSRFMNEEKAALLKCTFLQTGDVLIARMPDPLGRACLFPELGNDCVTVVDICIVRLTPDDLMENRLLKYWLNSPAIRNLVNMQATGTTRRRITKKKLSAFELPVPPRVEQKRISDKLDSLLAKVEAVQARLDKIPAILKRFRQSVLAAATSGELTKEWRGDEKYRDETLNWPISKIPESWDLKFLEEVAESRLGKMLDKSKNSGIATRYLGNINLRWHHIDLSELKEILVSQKEIDELNIRNGDLLLCEGGEPGRGAVWKGGDNNLVFQKAIHRVRCTDCISPEFLLYCIEDDFFSNRLSLLYTGTTIKHLTGKALKKYPVRIPPIAEQIEIVGLSLIHI